MQAAALISGHTPPRRAAARRGVRLDPPNAFGGAGQAFAPEDERPAWIASADPLLYALPAAPLADNVATPHTPPRKWLASVLTSIAIHAALSAFFLMRGESDMAQIAGAEESGILMQGNAAEDQARAGDIRELDPATNVSIVTMLAARPVESIEATRVEGVETIEAIETTIAAQMTTERLESVQETPQAEAPPDAAVIAMPDRAALVANEPSASVPPADTVPELLATDTPEIVTDDNIVAPVPRPAETTPRDTLAPVPPDAVAVEALPEVIESPKLERAAPTKPAKPAKAKPPAAPKADTKKPPKAAQASSGAGGRNSSDSKRGTADGEVTGTKADKAGTGRNSAAGNAAVSNYPGKVRARLSRALRAIPRSARASADSDVHVAFTVTANGSLGGVRIARSSGSPSLDNAALAAVRRAAPFPPIPPAAGRATWPFSIPLGLAK